MAPQWSALRPRMLLLHKVDSYSSTLISWLESMPSWCLTNCYFSTAPASSCTPGRWLILGTTYRQTLEAEQPPLAHGYGSRVRDGDGVKEDSWTSTDCIAAAVPMEWRGSNYSEMGDKTCQLCGRDEIIGAEESVLQQNLKLPKMDDVWFWWKDQVHMNNLSSSIFAFHYSTGQFPNSLLVLAGKIISMDIGLSKFIST
ncbi:uncharacterized protein LOC125550843 isoform X3 [Triticum urartu]|uniref:Uncharacterized protein n=1 Tax=Triticum urartu TaxID=4572 RepID=A0A8R7Q243_TRIUA|nr:uncharacterized protein LOC125550843 isoform X3 [Triticum urartu]